MKAIFSRFGIVLLMVLMTTGVSAQDFQGKAYYSSKTSVDMSRWGGSQMSEQQKKAIMDRMKSFLEKTYVLTFNKEESLFKEEEKLEAGAGGGGFGSWGSSFSPGPQYKNVKTKTYLQDQEFFGKQFLIKEEMQAFDWKMTSESKQIGKYTAYKAITMRPEKEVSPENSFRRRGNRDEETKKADSTNTDVASAEDEPEEEKMVEVIAWFTPQVSVSQGPAEYWGLPGLILELSAGNTVMLCTKIVMNPGEPEEIKVPEKGEVVTKAEYTQIITDKMEEMRNNRGRGRGGRSRF
ncbi:GLPGLI family protein [Winogradskyella maritima]|uniref:GLPGLI family protein n=1 Tax=Winogradskyella maritima TaxID=1517766 RepID=A0ABV8AG59_9FLAO|nr:GLPGLI family protein [Winogradskyella maritima]